MATLNGTSGNNTITGTANADTINGLAGNDHLLGQGGNDLIYGGIGDDKLEGGNGNDRLDGGAGVDFLGGGYGRDISDGGAGNDYLWDLVDYNTLRGGDGDDRLVSNQFSDLDGGTGNDTLVLDIDGLVASSSAGHYVGGAGSNTLLLNVEDASIRTNDGIIVTDPIVAVHVQGIGSNGAFGSVEIQDTVENSDVWTSVPLVNFDNMSVIDASNGSSLYFTGREDLSNTSSSGCTVLGSDGFDFINPGLGNDIIIGGGGGDSFYITGFRAGPDGKVNMGIDHITDFNKAQGDFLLIGYGDGSDGSHVEIEETATQTIVRSYVDGQTEVASTVILDVVGVQDHIIEGWQTV